MILLNSNWLIMLNSETPPGRVFGLDLQTFAQVAVVLLTISILSYVMTKLMYKPVKEFIKQRNDKIKGQQNQAKSDAEKVDELKLQYEEQMKAIEIERDEIIDSARKSAIEAGRLILSDAKKDADEILSAAKSKIQQDRKNAEDELKLHITQVSSAMSQRFLVRVVGENDHSKLYDEVIAE